MNGIDYSLKCSNNLTVQSSPCSSHSCKAGLPLFAELLLSLLLVAGQAKAFDQGFASEDNSVSTVLTSHVSGLRPIPPTDVVVFKGSGAWARVGIQRKLGGVATTLDLINPNHPEAPLCLIDNRSAAGAAWQSSMGVIDAKTDRLIHYNQACGNSDQNWGYVSTYDISDTKGFIQKQWLPLFSNDYKHPASPASPTTLTSPSPTHISNKIYPPLRLGDGKFNIVPELVRVGFAGVLRLTNNYTIRSIGNQSWKEFDFDQCLYLRPAAVLQGNLRVYIAQKGAPVVGPIRLCGDLPVALKQRVRNVVGDNEDWSISTHPLLYAVLVFNVAGLDIGIAVHQTNKQPFAGFLRYRPHLFTGVMAEVGQSSHQWHFSLRSEMDPSIKTTFRGGEVSTYSVQYDIAPLEQLAAEGFRIQ